VGHGSGERCAFGSLDRAHTLYARKKFRDLAARCRARGPICATVIVIAQGPVAISHNRNTGHAWAIHMTAPPSHSQGSMQQTKLMNAKNQRKPKASRFAVRANLLYAPWTLRLPSLNVRQIT